MNRFDLGMPPFLFDKFINKSGECWIWTGGKNGGGYGLFSPGQQKKKVLAHRHAWTLANGPIPAGAFVLHRCDVRACVNPAHLFLGTHDDNMRDMAAKGRAATGARNGMRLHPESALHGEKSPAARLTAEQVIEIRTRYASGESKASLARLFGVGHSTIGHVVFGDSWKRESGAISASKQQRITAATAARIAAEYAGGATMESLGSAHSVAVASVQRILRRAGVPPRPRGCQPRLLTTPDVLAGIAS